MITEAEKWCERHNVEFLEYGAGGFTFLANGAIGYMPYGSIKEGGIE